MVIGDGLLAPAISVFSAVSGLELSMSKDQHQYAVIPVTCFILVCLFALQHFGMHRVGFCFAPVVLTWLISTAAEPIPGQLARPRVLAPPGTAVPGRLLVAGAGH